MPRRPNLYTDGTHAWRVETRLILSGHTNYVELDKLLKWLDELSNGWHYHYEFIDFRLVVWFSYKEDAAFCKFFWGRPPDET